MTGGSTLLAFDFDGTLAGIREDPETVELSRAAAVLLEQASYVRGVAVAVVSGRDVQDLTRRVPVPGIYLVGSHGLDVAAPGGVMIRESRPSTFEMEGHVLGAIEQSGLRLERKKHGIAVHWRGGRSDAGVLEQFRGWARNAGLNLIEGRCVVEAREAGATKEDAVRWLASAIGASRIIYAGDDITDFGALRFAAQHGRALFLASGERTPPPGVTVVSSFRELFRIVREEVMM